MIDQKVDNVSLLGLQEAVVSNKDLDLPTQQELLAQFRCDEIASTAFTLFAEAIKSFPASQGTGKIVDGLGGMMKQVIQVAMGTSLLSSLPRTKEWLIDRIGVGSYSEL